MQPFKICSRKILLVTIVQNFQRLKDYFFHSLLKLGIQQNFPSSKLSIGQCCSNLPTLLLLFFFFWVEFCQHYDVIEQQVNFVDRRGVWWACGFSLSVNFALDLLCLDVSVDGISWWWWLWFSSINMFLDSVLFRPDVILIIKLSCDIFFFWYYSCNIS